MTDRVTDETRRRKALDDLILTRCNRVPCPVCSNKTEWQPGALSALVKVRPGYGGSSAGGVAHMPSEFVKPEDMVIPIRCSCGYIMLFYAKAVGAEPLEA